MKALVCGGRAYDDWFRVKTTLSFLSKNDEIICGGAPGADELAIKYARRANLIFHVYPAKWDVHGPKAGPIRNQEMLLKEFPDLVIAFPGGRGTADMVRRAEKSGIEVRQVVES